MSRGGPRSRCRCGTLRPTATTGSARGRSITTSTTTTGAWVGTTSRTHENVVPLLTPAVLVNLGAEYSPAAWCTLGAAGRYVGATHLDNTNSGDFTAPGFFGLDADASIALAACLAHSWLARRRGCACR